MSADGRGWRPLLPDCVLDGVACAVAWGPQAMPFARRSVFRATPATSPELFAARRRWRDHGSHGCQNAHHTFLPTGGVFVWRERAADLELSRRWGRQRGDSGHSAPRCLSHCGQQRWLYRNRWRAGRRRERWRPAGRDSQHRAGHLYSRCQRRLPVLFRPAGGKDMHLGGHVWAMHVYGTRGGRWERKWWRWRCR
jgi:hypothetical protein